MEPCAGCSMGLASRLGSCVRVILVVFVFLSFSWSKLLSVNEVRWWRSANRTVLISVDVHTSHYFSTSSPGRVIIHFGLPHPLLGLPHPPGSGASRSLFLPCSHPGMPPPSWKPRPVPPRPVPLAVAALARPGALHLHRRWTCAAPRGAVPKRRADGVARNGVGLFD